MFRNTSSLPSRPRITLLLDGEMFKRCVGHSPRARARPRPPITTTFLTLHQVFMLSLDTLRWSILDAHPVGFPSPAIHGHTTVEDPSMPGRLLVFGGRGSTHWNAEVDIWMSTRACYCSIGVDRRSQGLSSIYLGITPGFLSFRRHQDLLISLRKVMLQATTRLCVCT